MDRYFASRRNLDHRLYALRDVIGIRGDISFVDAELKSIVDSAGGREVECYRPFGPLIQWILERVSGIEIDIIGGIPKQSLAAVLELKCHLDVTRFHFDRSGDHLLFIAIQLNGFQCNGWGRL